MMRRMIRRVLIQQRLKAQAIRKLDLTEQQVASIRSIRQNSFQATKPQRQELRQLFLARKESGQLTPDQQARAKALREELRAARKNTRDRVLAVLTPEQRAQIEQWKQQRKARREQ
jgi:Spy/CpxP family protein refolding chaperone